MSWLTILAVGIGGAIGALCRSKATTYLKLHTTGTFPLPTLIVNLTSCFIAGVLLFFAAGMDQTACLGLTMGFLGGFSTLSTMNYEAVELMFAGHARTSLTYLATSYLSTLGAAALGFALAALVA